MSDLSDKKVDTKQYESILVISNALEIGAAVIDKISGNEVSNSLDGEVVNKKMLLDLLSAKLVQDINSNVQMKGAVK